eukprot:1554312-Pleurochrysis_carterae.AAC.2
MFGLVRDTGSHRKSRLLKYTSDATTMRLAVGTQMVYAPGERTLRPKLIPTQALASMRNVYCVCYRVTPEREGRTARGERRACEFHDRLNRSLGDSVELVHVRGAGSVVDAVGREELGEFV